MVSKTSTVLILLLALVAASNALERSHLRAKVSDLRAEVGATLFNGMVITLKGGRDNKMCKDEDPSGQRTKIQCHDSRRSATMFTVVNGGGGKFALRTGNKNLYLTVESLGGGKVALKKNNKYCADEGGNGIICTRGRVGGWEKFTMQEYKWTRYCSYRFDEV